MPGNFRGTMRHADATFSGFSPNKDDDCKDGLFDHLNVCLFLLCKGVSTFFRFPLVKICWANCLSPMHAPHCSTASLLFIHASLHYSTASPLFIHTSSSLLDCLPAIHPCILFTHPFSALCPSMHAPHRRSASWLSMHPSSLME